MPCQRACRLGPRLLKAKPLKRPAEHVAQPRQLLKVDVLAGNDLGLQALDLDGQRRRLPDEDLARLAQLVLAAEIIGKGDCDVAIAARYHASAVDAAKHQWIVRHGGADRERTRCDRRATTRAACGMTKH